MSIEKIKLKGGNKYRATCYVHGKRCRSQLYDRKIDAIAWEEETKNGLRPKTVPNFREAALERHEKHTKLHNKFGTLIKDEGLFRELFPVFGSRRLCDIQTTDIEEHLLTLQHRGLSKGSLKHRLNLIKAVYNWHIRRGVRVFNPCLAINIKINLRPPVHWTEQEANQFLDFTKSKYVGTKNGWVYLLYILALNTGCRRGEVYGLDWGKVNFSNEHILIDQMFDEKSGRVDTTTKSGKHRHVPINQTLHEILVQCQQGKRTGLIFNNLVGKPLDRRNFQKRHFLPDMIAAGVPRIKFHSLRDTYATIFMANGGSIYHLKELLGHSSLQMTMKYTHFHPDHAVKNANMVNIGGSGKVIEVNFKKKLG